MRINICMCFKVFGPKVNAARANIIIHSTHECVCVCVLLFLNMCQMHAHTYEPHCDTHAVTRVRDRERERENGKKKKKVSYKSRLIIYSIGVCIIGSVTAIGMRDIHSFLCGYDFR